MTKWLKRLLFTIKTFLKVVGLKPFAIYSQYMCYIFKQDLNALSYLAQMLWRNMTWLVDGLIILV